MDKQNNRHQTDLVNNNSFRTYRRCDRRNNFNSMKCKELEKKLRRASCYLKREGSSHS